LCTARSCNEEFFRTTPDNDCSGVQPKHSHCYFKSLKEDYYVGYPDLEILSNNWLISDYEVTPMAASDANLVMHYKIDGDLDDVRIYSRALSQGEVASLAGKTAPFAQPLYLLLTPQDPAINVQVDSVIDLKDYALLVDHWLDEILWP
jgi:hypothetical protein